MLRFFWDEAVALDPAIEPKDERHMKLSRQGQLGDLWRKAGLINIKEEPLTDRPSVFIIQRLLGAVYQRCRPRGRLCRVAFGGSPPTARSSHAQTLAWGSSGWPVHVESESLVRARGSSQALTTCGFKLHDAHLRKKADFRHDSLTLHGVGNAANTFGPRLMYSSDSCGDPMKALSRPMLPMSTLWSAQTGE